MLNFFASTIVGARIAFVMADVAIGLALNQGGPAAHARVQSRFGSVMNGKDVLAVHFDSGQTVGFARLATLVFLVARENAISVAYKLFSQT